MLRPPTNRRAALLAAAALAVSVLGPVTMGCGRQGSNSAPSDSTGETKEQKQARREAEKAAREAEKEAARLALLPPAEVVLSMARTNGPLLRFEKRGGFVGYMVALELSADGHWTIESLVDKRRLGSGRLPDEDFAGAKKMLSTYPRRLYGKFDVPGADLFEYRLLIHTGTTPEPMVAGVWPGLGFEGQGGGVPHEWSPLFERLDALFAEAGAVR